jgi:dihydrofolate reductase
MRKLVVLSFVSLDGVMQAPGGPEEDTSGGFRYGGWTVPYFDEFLGNVMDEQIRWPFDLLLGRRTYEIFAAYWPYADEKENSIVGPFNRATKYVASKTLTSLDWANSRLIRGDVAQGVRELKEQDGPELQVHGSGNLIQTLLKNDLVDELWLKIFPLTLGPGKRLFDGGAIPAGFRLLDSKSSSTGIIVANYGRAGAVSTGSFGAENPSEAELARRERIGAGA